MSLPTTFGALGEGRLEWGACFLEDQLHETRGGAADRGHGVSWDGDQWSIEEE